MNDYLGFNLKEYLDKGCTAYLEAGIGLYIDLKNAVDNAPLDVIEMSITRSRYDITTYPNLEFNREIGALDVLLDKIKDHDSALFFIDTRIYNIEGVQSGYIEKNNIVKNEMYRIKSLRNKKKDFFFIDNLQLDPSNILFVNNMYKNTHKVKEVIHDNNQYIEKGCHLLVEPNVYI